LVKQLVVGAPKRPNGMELQNPAMKRILNFPITTSATSEMLKLKDEQKRKSYKLKKKEFQKNKWEENCACHYSKSDC
jgi:hypothetical protein